MKAEVVAYRCYYRSLEVEVVTSHYNESKSLVTISVEPVDLSVLLGNNLFIALIGWLDA